MLTKTCYALRLQSFLVRGYYIILWAYWFTTQESHQLQLVTQLSERSLCVQRVPLVSHQLNIIHFSPPS